MAVAVLSSLFVAPVHAGDDGDDVTVGDDGVSVGDDDGVSVGVDDEGNVSVSGDVDSDGADATVEVNTDDGSASVGTDGVETDTGDSDGGAPPAEPPAAEPPAAELPDAPGVEGLVGAPSLPDLSGVQPNAPDAPESGNDDPIEAPDLPISYDDIPLEDLPVDACVTPLDRNDIPQPVDPYNPPGEENLPREIPSAPVNPYNPPVSAPFTQCDIFNPYAPPFDPTNPPDDPSVENETYSREVSPDRVIYSGEIEGETGEGGPALENYGYIVILPNENTTIASTNPTVSDGEKEYEGDILVEKGPGQRQGNVTAAVVIIDRGASGGLICDGQKCQPYVEGGLQQDIPTIPTGGGGVPCDPPAGPGDAPGVPSPPAEPPEQVPEPPEVDPSTIPEPNYCFVFNPNNPPQDPNDPPQSPYQERETYRDDVGPNGGVYSERVEAGLDPRGPNAASYHYFGSNEESYFLSDTVTIDDGQKEYVVDVYGSQSNDTSTLAGRQGVAFTIENGSTSATSNVYVVCDDEQCWVTSQGDFGATDDLPPVTYNDGEDDGSSSQSSSTSSTSTTRSTSTTSTSDSASTAGTSGGAGDTAAQSVDSVSAGGAPSAGVTTGVSGLLRNFQNGVDSPSEAMDTLFELV